MSSREFAKRSGDPNPRTRGACVAGLLVQTSNRPDTSPVPLEAIRSGAEIGWNTVLAGASLPSQRVPMRCRCGRFSVPTAEHVMAGIGASRFCGLHYDLNVGSGHGLWISPTEIRSDLSTHS